MKIEEIAEKHKLRTKKLAGETIILGRIGHIYQASPVLLGALVDSSTRGWNSAKRIADTADLKIAMDGDTEGVILFDPKIPKQRQAGFKLIGAKRTKQLSPEHLARLTAASKKYRQSK